MSRGEGLILHIDTSTDICSVALSLNSMLISSCADESKERRHAALLPGMLKDLLHKSSKTLQQVSAIAYSQGPGSYTGLRVGLSSAKAICMALELPLIAVSTLHALAHSVLKTIDYDFIISMIDAGRNEVYHAVYDNQYELVSAPQPLILKENSFEEHGANGKKIILVGDGSIKAKVILKASDSVFYGGEKMLAQHMIVPATNKFLTYAFEDLAYSVPFYLKSPQYKKSFINN